MKRHGAPSLILALVVLLIPILSACTSNNTPTTTTTPPTTTTPVSTALLPTVAGVDANLLYVSKCAGCHGLNLQGGVGPNITDTSNFSAAFLSTFLSVHHAPGLTQSLRDVLADYLKINSKPASTTSGAFSSDPAVLYANNCALCHGFNRAGGLGGPDITQLQITNLSNEAQVSTFLSAHFTGIDLSQNARDLLAHFLKTS